MDSWQEQLTIGVSLLTVLAVGAMLPVVQWRIRLRSLVISVLSMLLILPVVIILIVALSVGSTI
ncbi:hypothetical protein J2793_007445 [Paraburkholderia caledonica]|uniref:Uncharacterized protein n=1 Tax=Paraburkholderia caledonica TaxID=134536 RepID=A0AB73IPM0_9BURK|nr:hypothetical protein [Paraburkholderia caledonica]